MLAARFGISPETIMAANGLRNPDLLQVGQDLLILPTDGVLYTLRAGESIRQVAARFNVATDDIIRANMLGPNPDVVQPGTKLMVPGATPVMPHRLAIVQSGSSDQQEASIGGVGLPLEDTAYAVPSTRTYEVQTGDTLAGIADTFGVDVQTILSSNGIDDADTIRPGSELRILPVKGLEYSVQPDETLADIAWRYQVDLGLLLDYNDLNDPDVIRIGAKLVVPGGKLRPDPTPASPAVVAPQTQPVASSSGAIVAAPAPKPAAAPKSAAASSSTPATNGRVSPSAASTRATGSRTTSAPLVSGTRLSWSFRFRVGGACSPPPPVAAPLVPRCALLPAATPRDVLPRRGR